MVVCHGLARRARRHASRLPDHLFPQRDGLGQDSRSAFAPRQILLAHAALSDPAVGHLLHGERIARRDGAGAGVHARRGCGD
jgi:predicted secreted hydrolase